VTETLVAVIVAFAGGWAARGWLARVGEAFVHGIASDPGPDPDYDATDAGSPPAGQLDGGLDWPRLTRPAADRLPHLTIERAR
jgi:hypothetical protein